MSSLVSLCSRVVQESSWCSVGFIAYLAVGGLFGYGVCAMHHGFHGPDLILERILRE